jgi:hypothetical protein
MVLAVSHDTGQLRRASDRKATAARRRRRGRCRRGSLSSVAPPQLQQRSPRFCGGLPNWPRGPALEATCRVAAFHPFEDHRRHVAAAIRCYRRQGHSRTSLPHRTIATSGRCHVPYMSRKRRKSATTLHTRCCLLGGRLPNRGPERRLLPPLLPRMLLCRSHVHDASLRRGSRRILRRSLGLSRSLLTPEAPCKCSNSPSSFPLL